MREPLTIGKLAEATGVSAKTIRYYEEVGVLPRPGRTATGYRQYTQQGVDRLRFVRRARALGLPLKELKTLTAGLDDGPAGAVRPRLLELVRAQLSAVEQQITELQVLRGDLEQLVHRLRAPARRGRSGRCGCLETS
jgi:MerR family copper efflux transcriptional regulator